MARHELDASEIRPSVSMFRLLVLGEGRREGLLRTLDTKDATRASPLGFGHERGWLANVETFPPASYGCNDFAA